MLKALPLRMWELLAFKIVETLLAFKDVGTVGL